MQMPRKIWAIAAVGALTACSQPRTSTAEQNSARSDVEQSSPLVPLDQHEILHLVGGHSFMADPNISSGGVERFDDSMTYHLSGPVGASGEYTISNNRLCVQSPVKVASRCFELFWSGRTILRADPMQHPNDIQQNLRPLRPAQTRMKRTPTPDETARCQPHVTDIPDGSARLRCQVGAEGRLERCVVLSTTNAGLGEWGLCMAAGFLADEAQAGQEVELPLKWRRPS